MLARRAGRQIDPTFDKGSDMAHFILVHGMFHGGWCWDRLKSRLEADGHTVDAPDLAGCGVDTTPPGEVGLRNWADAIAGLAERASTPAVLVGHSRGGLVISQAAEQVSDRIGALVYVTALMLPDGASAQALPQIMQEEGMVANLAGVAPRMNAQGTALHAPEGADALFYGVCSAEDRAWATPQLGPEPLAPLGTPLAISAAKWGRLPRIYVETTKDQTLPIEAQRAMIARTGATEVHTLEADHMPILTHVPELATILERTATLFASSDGVAVP
jgi:pimeloyl-ACP methyl ester carboxylesterase